MLILIHQICKLGTRLTYSLREYVERICREMIAFRMKPKLGKVTKIDDCLLLLIDFSQALHG